MTVLEPGTTVERELVRREEHLYQLTLTKDECVSVIVEQRGIDVVAQVRRPDGSVIADFQSEIRRNGTERVDIVADAGGTYVLGSGLDQVSHPPRTPSGSRAVARRPTPTARCRKLDLCSRRGSN